MHISLNLSSFHQNLKAGESTKVPEIPVHSDSKSSSESEPEGKPEIDLDTAVTPMAERESSSESSDEGNPREEDDVPVK